MLAVLPVACTSSAVAGGLLAVHVYACCALELCFASALIHHAQHRDYCAMCHPHQVHNAHRTRLAPRGARRSAALTVPPSLTPATSWSALRSFATTCARWSGQSATQGTRLAAPGGGRSDATEMPLSNSCSSTCKKDVLMPRPPGRCAKRYQQQGGCQSQRRL